MSMLMGGGSGLEWCSGVVIQPRTDPSGSSLNPLTLAPDTIDPLPCSRSCDPNIPRDVTGSAMTSVPLSLVTAARTRSSTVMTRLHEKATIQ